MFQANGYAEAASSPYQDNIRALLGPAIIAPQTISSSRQFNGENISMGNAYNGRNVYLETMLSMEIKSTYNEFILQYFLPIRERFDIHFKWTGRTFHRMLAPQTSEHGAPDLVQNSQFYGEANMNCFKLGTVMGTEVLKTEDGQAVMEGNLVNLVMGFLDTMQIQGINALLKAKENQVDILQSSRGLVYKVGDLFAWSKKTFDILRKEERGYFTLIEEIRKGFDQIIPTDAIITQGMRSLIAHDDSQVDYFRHGPGSQAIVENGAGALGNLIAGLRTHISREIASGVRGEANIAPFKRIITIGDHWRMFDTTLHTGSNYTSRSRDTEVFDMSVASGDFTIVHFMDTIDWCGRFTRDNNLGALSSKHTELARNVENTRAKMRIQLDNGKVDMFVHAIGSGQYEVCQLFGQMEPDNLPYAGIRATAECIRDRIREQLCNGDEDAICAGLALKDRIFHKVLGAADFAFMKSITGGVVNNLGVLAGNNFGGHPINTKVTSADKLPAGYGSIVGVQTIGATTAGVSDISQENINIASQFSQAVDRYTQAASSMFVGTHAAFDGNMTPNFFSGTSATYTKKQSGSVTSFAQNLLDYNKLPLYFDNKADAIDLSERITNDDDVDKLRSFIGKRGTPELDAFLNAPKPQADDDGPADIGFSAKFNISPFSKKFISENDNVNTGLASFIVELLSIFKNNNRIDGDFGAANLTINVVRFVEAGSAPKNSINRELKEWVEQSEPLADSGTRGSSNLALTRLVVSPEQLFNSVAAGFNKGSFLLASPTDLSKAISGSDSSATLQRLQADSRKSYETLFRNSATPNTLNHTDNLAARFAQAGDLEKNPFMRAAIQLVLLTPICRKSIQLWHTNNIRIPVEILAERFNRRYVTESIIVASNGEAIGETAFMSPDVQTSLDTIANEITINAGLWFTPVVYGVDRYYVARDVLVSGYNGGENTLPIEPANFRSRNKQDGSVIYIMVPFGSLESSVEKTHDIRGRFDDALLDGNVANSTIAALQRKPHYPSAMYTEILYKVSRLRPQSKRDLYTRNSGKDDNSITHQTHQWNYNPNTGKFDIPVLNTGYFGENIYAGHGALRTMGSSEHYKVCNYSTR